jgi:16S rRNA (uracil1498-N3)-methyltransferase
MPARLPPILLFQALPKGAKMDLIVRQAAEGGLTEIIPFVSAYSALGGRGAGSGGEEKVRRWARIIKEARQQSGSGIATSIGVVRKFDDIFRYWGELSTAHPSARGILMHQDPLEQGTLHGYLDRDPELVAVAVGPEGGFSPEEVSRFLTAGFRPLRIGDTVLRTETAALYAAAVVRIILLESASWMPKIP